MEKRRNKYYDLIALTEGANNTVTSRICWFPGKSEGGNQHSLALAIKHRTREWHNEVRQKEIRRVKKASHR